jgi:hypothetical protein
VIMPRTGLAQGQRGVEGRAGNDVGSRRYRRRRRPEALWRRPPIEQCLEDVHCEHFNSLRADRVDGRDA